MVYSILINTIALLSTVALIIILALICLRLKPFKNPAQSMLPKTSIGLLLGLLAIFATLMGTTLSDGTIINVRELAVMIAGVAGGPVLGLTAGVIGGLHRYTVGGATALPCAISTIAIGIISGLAWMKITGKAYLLKAALLAFALECGAMVLILALVQPFDVTPNLSPEDRNPAYLDSIAYLIPMSVIVAIVLVCSFLLYRRYQKNNNVNMAFLTTRRTYPFFSFTRKSLYKQVVGVL